MDISEVLTIINKIIAVANSIEVRNIAIIFLLNLAGTTLSNLKTVFLAKQITKPVYFATFLDATIFTYAISLVAQTPSIPFIFGYATGKLGGVYLGEVIDAKLALGTLEVTVYKHPEDGIPLADELRELGYSVTTVMGYGIYGRPRIMLQIIVPRKHINKLKEHLKDSPNIAIKDVTKAQGKIGRVILD